MATPHVTKRLSTDSIQPPQKAQRTPIRAVITLHLSKLALVRILSKRICQENTWILEGIQLFQTCTTKWDNFVALPPSPKAKSVRESYVGWTECTPKLNPIIFSVRTL